MSLLLSQLINRKNRVPRPSLSTGRGHKVAGSEYSTLRISRIARDGGGVGGMVDLSRDLPIQAMDKSAFSKRRSTYPRYGKVDLF